jgi:hypothetical protein
LTFQRKNLQARGAVFKNLLRRPASARSRKRSSARKRNVPRRRKSNAKRRTKKPVGPSFSNNTRSKRPWKKLKKR